MSNPTPRFTGIFIPAEILEMQELSLFEMLLLSWIDALYCPEHGGCYASNHYLGQKIKGAQENTVAKAICNLRKLGLIEDVSFDGRKRVIRALISKHVNKHQSKTGLDENPTRVGPPSNAKLDENPSNTPLHIITYSKIESKGREHPKKSSFSRIKKQEPKPKPEMIKIGEYVEVSKAFHDAMIEKHGKAKMETLWRDMNDWIPNKHKYKDYEAATRKWLNNNLQSQQSNGGYDRSRSKLAIEADKTRLAELKAKGSGFFEENDIEKALEERMRTKGY